MSTTQPAFFLHIGPSDLVLSHEEHLVDFLLSFCPICTPLPRSWADSHPCILYLYSMEVVTIRGARPLYPPKMFPASFFFCFLSTFSFSPFSVLHVRCASIGECIYVAVNIAKRESYSPVTIRPSFVLATSLRTGAGVILRRSCHFLKKLNWKKRIKKLKK